MQMFRTVGFLIGFSLASIGLLFLVDTSSALRTRDAVVELIERFDIALPERFASSRSTLATAVAPEPSSTPAPGTMQTQTALADEQPGPGEQPQRSARTEQNALGQTQTKQDLSTTPAPMPVQTVETPMPVQTVETPMPVQTVETPMPARLDPLVPAPARNWHVFWSPFGSEYAANGFAERLTGLTGLDFTVIREGPGEYQVAFAYADENERSAGLAMIETQTGLRLRTPNP